MINRTPTQLEIQRTVLIADDESSIRLLVHATIESDDYRVVEASDGAQAWALTQELKPKLVLLDVQMPGRSGLEVLRSIKADEGLKATRVILLTSKAQERDIEVGLIAGADFYLTKPFSLTEFEARVRALLRRTSLPAGPIVIGDLSIDIEAKRVTANGVAVDLTVREWALLELFLTRPGRVLSKEFIGQQLFNYDEHLSINTIEVYVSRLRAKIEPEPDRPRFIQTVWGLGYRFSP